MKSKATPFILASMAALVALADLRAETQTAPRVLFDEGHHNVFVSDGKGKELANLLRRGGFVVTPGSSELTLESLKAFDVLLIAGPRGGPRTASMEDRSQSAFTAGEVEAILLWVEDGGGLFLITDHPPIGSASLILAQQFEIDLSLAFTEDPSQGGIGEATGIPWATDGRDILFSRADGTVGEHSVMAGRSPEERVNRVATYLGQSLAGPPGSCSFLKLAPTAVDRHLGWAGDHWEQPSANDRVVSAAGRSQGLAMIVGTGRVIATGEAGMFGNRGITPNALGPDGRLLDNAQMALNISWWLAGKEYDSLANSEGRLRNHCSGLDRALRARPGSGSRLGRQHVTGRLGGVAYQ